MAIPAIQCQIKTKHPHHEWRDSNGIICWCAGVDVTKLIIKRRVAYEAMYLLW